MISLLIFLLGALYGAGAARAFFVAREFCDLGFFGAIVVAALWPLFLLLCLFVAVAASTIGEISWREPGK